MGNHPNNGHFWRFLPQKVAVKLALVICLLVFALLSILGLSLTQLTRSVLKENIKNSNEEIAMRAAHEVSSFVIRPSELLETAAKMIGRVKANAWDQETVLVELSLQFPMFEKIVSVNLEGNEIASSNPGHTKILWSNREYFQRSLKGNIDYSPLRIGSDYLPYTTISLPYYEMGKVAGVLIAKVNLRGMWEIVDSIRVGGTGRAQLLSEEGLVIAHPDKRMVLKNVRVGAKPFLKKVFTEKKATLEQNTEDKTSYLASFAAVPGPLALITVIQIPLEEAYQPLRKMQAFSWFLLALSLALSGIVSFVLARWLVRPIKSLQSWSKRVAMGDFDFRLAPHSLDEIGRLFIMFRRMSHRLKTAREKERWAILGEAASTISHKLKNSIVSLKTFAQLFPQRKRDENFIQRFEKDFPSSVEYLEKIFHNLSHISSSHKPNMDTVKLDEIILKIQAAYADTLERLNIDLQTEVSANLPFVFGDKDQLHELFVNLVQNSIQAMPQGGSLTLSALYKPHTAHLQVFIQDTGGGISRTDLDRIFKPFFTTKRGGMGLGLTISKKIAEDHNGRISVESHEGQGSTFIVNLPAVTRNHKITIDAPSERAP